METPESYKDFAQRYQKAETLPKAQRGAIFIGNTRAGKSTLACGLAGAKLMILYDNELTYINPTEEKYKDKVRNCQTSVTEMPNFYLKNGLAIIDMPGHSDNSKFRELINFHYIKTMASRLQEVTFFMVVNVRNKNNTYILPDYELAMIDSFIRMFPDCSRNVTIIANRITKPYKAEDVKRGIRNFLLSPPQNPSQIQKSIKNYFTGFNDNKIVLVQFPPYKLSLNGEKKYSQPYILPSQIAGLPNKAQYIRLNINRYQKYNLFSEGNQHQNHRFQKIIFQYEKQIYNRFEAALKIFNALIFFNIKASVEGKSYKNQIETSVKQFLDLNDIPGEIVQVIKYPNEGNLQYQSSKIIKFIHELSNIHKDIQNIDKKYSQYYESHVKKLYQAVKNKTTITSKKFSEKYEKEFTYIQHKALLNKLLTKIIHISLQHSKDSTFQSLLRKFHLYILRRFQEINFLDSFVILESSQTHFENYQIHQIYNRILQMNTSMSKNGLYDQKKSYSQFFKYLKKLYEDYINTNIKTLPNILNVAPELVDSLRLIKQDYQNLTTEAISQAEEKKKIIDKKLEEIKFQSVIIKPIEGQAKNINESITSILQIYGDAQESSKIPLLRKLSQILEKQKDYKSAIVLNFHLSLNQEVLRIVQLIKKDEIGEFLILLGDEFFKKGKVTYAERCYEKAKIYIIDNLERYVEVEKKCLRLQDEDQRLKLKEPRLAKIRSSKTSEMWDWRQIDIEIYHLKYKFKALTEKDQKEASKLNGEILFVKSRSSR